MYPIKKDYAVKDMVDIGSVANLGAEVLAGNPEAKGSFLVGNPETNLAVAFFYCTKGSFRVDYPFSEHGTVLNGTVTLTNEATGQKETYEQGDSWYINKGDVVVFDIETEDFLKHYMSIVEA